MSSQRVEWVDTLRGIGILIVVYGHNQIELGPSKYLELVMVPLFFFASGLVFRPGKYANYWAFARRRLQGLIIPYLIYSVISWIFWIGLWVWLHYSQGQQRFGLLFVLLTPLVGIPYGAAADKIMLYNLPLWFLTCLFCADSFFYLLQRRIKSGAKLMAVMILLSLVGFGIGKKLPIPLPWNADTALTVMVYYGAGYLFRQRYGLSFDFAWWKKIVIGAAFFVASVYACDLNPQTHLYNNEIGKWWAFHLTSVASLVFFVMLAQLLARTWVISQIRRNALIVLGALAALIVVFPYFHLDKTALDFQNAPFVAAMVLLWCAGIVVLMLPLIGYFGRNTLPLLGMHVVLMMVFRGIAYGAYGIDSARKDLHITLWALYWGTGIVLLTLPLIWLFNRYVPWAVGRLPGKKVAPPKPAALPDVPAT